MNSAVRSLLPAKAKRWVFIGGAVLLLLVLVARLFGDNDTALAALIVGAVCLAALALTWLLISLFLRMGRRKRQRKFDAGIAAREGIDDRKREWHSWVAELEKNNIDRYELPFYLLVGEPQSGKSVLLQNSDLKFLFGQSRLSGIGGTRGCDWWFTEEAVILDLAGRLFTHEGGAADEAEWEAFLDLVNDFRPLDPANGIMLVIPCDGLLGESLEVCAQKANKTREALLSLTRKLEAKLPIYVVLTKADKIFGFAETVHRLSLEQRHQMFGWSRSAERLEEPFDSNELHEAWGGIVQRGAALRDQMLGTLRLPEGLPEVDRMLGFPEELKGMAEPLEAYLNRIFLGSELVDQLYFRGIYLTSGLQSGAPIAKVFLDILDRPGEADGRDLEKLFVRQQAYFIKDLVRKRVFGERGLVKPTSTRVERAKKKAWVGYGLAASVAFISLIWGAFEIRAYHKASGQDIYDAAISAANDLTPESLEDLKTKGEEPPKVSSLLGTLEAVQTARDRNPTVMQRLHASRQPHLETLYETIYDDVYRYRLQTLAANTLLATTSAYDPNDPSKRPADYDALIKEATVAATLIKGITDADSAKIIASVLPEELDAERVEEAHGYRGDGFAVDVGDSGPAVQAAISKLLGLWDATLDPVDPIGIGGSVGYCLSWYELTLIEAQLLEYAQALDLDGGANLLVHGACERALHVIADLGEKPNYEVGKREIGDFQLESHELEKLRAELRSVVSAGDATEAKPWGKKKVFVDWLKGKGLGTIQLAKEMVEDVGNPTVKPEVLEPLRQNFLKNNVLLRVTKASWLGPAVDTTPALLIPLLVEAMQLANSSDDELVKSIVRLKLRLARDRFLGDYGDWDSIHAAVHPEQPESGQGQADVPDSLLRGVATQTAILDYIRLLDGVEGGPADLEPVGDRLRLFAEAGVNVISESLADAALDDQGAVKLLLRTGKDVPKAKSNCVSVIRDHIRDVRKRMEQDWAQLVAEWKDDGGGPAAPMIADQVNEHLVAVQDLFSEDSSFQDNGRVAWIERAASLLDERLKLYSGRVQEAVKEHASFDDPDDLSAACRQVSETLIGGSNLKPLYKWIEEMYAAERVPKPTNESLVTFFRTSAGESTALEDYARVAQLGSFDDDEKPPAVLRLHVRGFLDGSAARKGAGLATKFFESSHKFLAVEDDRDSSEHGILLEFSRELSRSFNAIVLSQLRADYLDEFTRTVVKEGRDEVDDFWYDPALPRPDGVKPMRDSVGYFFGAGGEYLRLLDRYSIPEHTGSDFRIGAQALAGAALDTREQRRWQLDHFMQQMLLYVRGAQELADLVTENRTQHPLDTIETLTIELEMYSPDVAAHEETWNRWDVFRSTLFTQGKAKAITRGRDMMEPVNGWGFDKDRVFDLRWQNRSDEGWQDFECPSCMVPLLLFWSDRTTWASADPAVTKQERSAIVDFHVTGDERAPLKLTITPAPPRRPDLDLNTLLGG